MLDFKIYFVIILFLKSQLKFDSYRYLGLGDIIFVFVSFSNQYYKAVLHRNVYFLRDMSLNWYWYHLGAFWCFIVNVTFFFFKILFIYSWETQRGREKAGSMQGAWRGTRSWVSRIRPWAEGGTKPLSHPGCPDSKDFDKIMNL